MTFCDLEPLFYIKLELEREKKNLLFGTTENHIRNKNHFFYKVFTDAHLVYDRISSCGTLEKKKQTHFLRVNFSELLNCGLGPDFANSSPYLILTR